MKECPLCLRWDCECENLLTKEEFDKLVESTIKLNEKGFRDGRVT